MFPFPTEDVATEDEDDTTTLSRKVVVQRLVMFASRFVGKMDMQPDFPFNCEVCFGLPSSSVSF